MRHLRDLPDEEIIIASGSEILELVVNAMMGDDHPEPPTPFETPSLHDLYDLEVDVPEDDPNEKAVNDLFSDAALLAAEEASSPSSDSDSSLHTPRHDRGEKEIPGLKWEKMDLRCYEECLPPSDDEDEQAIQNAASHGVQAVSESFALDCPPLPGHGCPVSDADDETPTTESTLSPPEIGTSPSDNIVRPVPVRATGRRAAVECLDDLLQGGDEPLDLCTRKRPRH
ncbi:early E1A 24.6 kDa protein [Human mastadenovirus E]|uniref:Early E1A protein n=2 Tax=Human mastadenovirus E TaxID=130308 RepID=Q5GFD1_ADE04|nr:early E1A 24.6 kDa protein [Human adenovirus E4]AAT97477.1 early E1A 24.6 kDa protein [Human adenovirus E4]AVQ69352.1 early E1A 24.6 kDa protein [Human mastadenovirus E]QOX73549.1 early E1A 24.6 kDa protein [Human adenovirus E4]